MEIAEQLVRALHARGASVVVAESLTAGLVTSSIAEIPGASSVLWGGFVTYREETKSTVLGVDPELISVEGVVSEAVASAMARGALHRAGVDWAVSTTGAAGPDECGPNGPVGKVCFAILHASGYLRTETCRFVGQRAEIRAAAAQGAMHFLLKNLDSYQKH